MIAGGSKYIESLEWYRQFGCKLWYQCRARDQVSKIFKDAHKDFEKTPHLISNQTKQNKFYLDLNYILMGVYSGAGFNVNELMDARNYSNDQFDVLYLWFACEYLEKNTKVEIKFDNSFRYRLLRDFCYQLELVGAWTFAIYAILVSNESKKL
jgi:hypothetical protein